MPADLVTRIAGESEQNPAQREQLNKQLDVPVKGSDTCKRFIGVRLFGKKALSMSLAQLLLMYWIDADDDPIQLDSMTTPISSFSAISTWLSADSLQEDIRSLSDKSLSCKSSPTEVLDFASTGSGRAVRNLLQ